jgi:hypothetical protein
MQVILATNVDENENEKIHLYHPFLVASQNK